MGYSRWKALIAQMAVLSGHDFERAVVPYLRIKWPELAYPKGKKYLDRAGIDQMWEGRGAKFEVVIQCKGYEVLRPLDKSQIDKIAKSLGALKKSPYRVKRYVLLYNRRGEDQPFEQHVRALLQAAVDDGLAEVAELWNLSNFVNEIGAAMLDTILSRLQAKAAAKHEREQDYFRFGRVIVEKVPCSKGQLRVESFTPPAIEDQGNKLATDPINELHLDDRTVTLVIGRFGAGKSTMSYRLASYPGKTLVYVPASVLTHAEKGGSASENSLAAGIVDYLGIFDDQPGLEPSEIGEVIRLAGPILAACLRSQGSGLVLLIDAIDENRFYSSARGFQLLTNELSRVDCPIVITTRLEHFQNCFVDYAGPLGSKSKYRAGPVSLLTLENWQAPQVSEYISAALDIARKESDDTAVSGLLSLQESHASGKLGSLAIEHPLFLAMTVELAAAGIEPVYKNKFELYENWCAAKLRRDFTVDRARPAGFSSDRLLIGGILSLMTKIAAAMSIHGNAGMQLVETIDEEAVRKIGLGEFGNTIDSDVYAVTAFLEPVGGQHHGHLRLRFFHKSIQEFFTARWILSNGIDAKYYPSSVSEFLRIQPNALSGSLP